jgi:hypothetical protein
MNLLTYEIYVHATLFTHTEIYYCIAGWSAVPEEKASRYRLSIKDVQPQDSGTYTCASPRGLTNSITIVVAGTDRHIPSNLL